MTLIYEPRGKAGEYAKLALNIYKGCSHGCSYCYAPAATFTQRKIFNSNPQVRKNFFQQLEKDLVKYQGDPRPILLSFTSDPYQPLEESTKLTRIVIRKLLANGNSVNVLTKGGTRAIRDFDIMKSKFCSFGTTLTFLDEKKSLEWEPGAATPKERIAAIRSAKNAGIKTWVSLEPVIDPSEVYKIIELTHEFVDMFKVGKLNYHPLAKTIDWKSFRISAEDLLSSLNKKYYIKEDLKKFI